MTRSEAWECLRGDPLPWLLDENHPNLQWKVLTDLFHRPSSSPAVARARGGANAVEPVASLIADFGFGGEEIAQLAVWKTYSGLGWRLVAAVQWGADPTDPRLQAAAERLLEHGRDVSGFPRIEGVRADPLLTARALQALAGLGWCHHPRFQEALAWLEEGAPPANRGGWRAAGRKDEECPVTAVAVLGAIESCGEKRRARLFERALASIDRTLDPPRGALARLGHPCLGRTDFAEILNVLAQIQAPLLPSMTAALARLQHRQIVGARWRRRVPVPATLPGDSTCRAIGPSRWVTLKCVTALMHYGVEADLPRMFPQKPGSFR